MFVKLAQKNNSGEEVLVLVNINNIDLICIKEDFSEPKYSVIGYYPDESNVTLSGYYNTIEEANKFIEDFFEEIKEMERMGVE